MRGIMCSLRMVGATDKGLRKMAHQIHIAANGTASMAYVGATPWHGLGQELQAGQTIEQWQTAAGMGYTVERAVVQYACKGWADTEIMRQCTGKDVLFRSDDGYPLGVVSDGYKIVQPSEVLEFFRGLCDGANMELETAGVLKHGALYWALARTGHVTTGKNASRGYVLLSTSADGTKSTDARFTDVRAVCANTIAIALRGNTGVKTSHRSQFSASATKQALGLVDFAQSWEAFHESMRKLMDVPMSGSQATTFFADLLRPPSERSAPRKDMGAQTFEQLLQAPVSVRSEPVKVDKPRAIRGLEDLEQSYYRAPGAVPGTAYGALQGVTHYIDHVRGTSDDKRLTSAWFGQGDTMKQTALEQLLAMA